MSYDEDIPRRAVKYGSADILRYFRAGSLRFGSLLNYKRGENHRFTDFLEGVINQSGSFHYNGSISQADFGGLEIKDSRGASVRNFANIFEVNEFVFCCSLGNYSIDHHREMLEKNPDLTHYVEFDLWKLIHSLNSYLSANRSIKIFDGLVNIVYGRITYGDHVSPWKVDDLGSGNFALRMPDAEVKLRKIFNKPYLFEHEKEFRIMFRRDSTREADPSRDADFIVHKGVTRSVLRRGRLVL